jgi:hypothetical protein
VFCGSCGQLFGGECVLWHLGFSGQLFFFLKFGF